MAFADGVLCFWALQLIYGVDQTQCQWVLWGAARA